MTRPEPTTLAETHARYVESRERMGMGGRAVVSRPPTVVAAAELSPSSASAAAAPSTRLDPHPADVAVYNALAAGRPVMARKIIAVVAREYGVTPADIVGPRRTRAIVDARFAAIAAVSAVRPDLSTPALGKIFGDRDHTTILNARRRHAEREAAQ